MENKILSLQKIIQKRAEKKLKAEINELDSFLRKKHSLLTDFNITLDFEGGNKKERKVSQLFYFTGEGELHNLILKTHMARYVEEETKLFLQEIEDVQNNMYQLQQELEEING